VSDAAAGRCSAPACTENEAGRTEDDAGHKALGRSHCSENVVGKGEVGVAAAKEEAAAAMGEAAAVCSRSPRGGLALELTLGVQRAGLPAFRMS
jgi:hypothetical protein